MTSLEELLADDGFKKARLWKDPGRNMAHLKPVSMPLYAASKHNPPFRHANNPSNSKFSRRSHSSVSEAVRHPPDPTLLFRPRRSSVSGFKIDGFDERESGDDSVDDEIHEGVIRHCRMDEKNPAPPAIDEAATHALVAILVGYIRRFFKDENYRASLRHSCLSWLKSSRKEGGDDEDDEAVADLEDAIGAIERAVEGALDSKDMKRASLRLSLMAGLSSGDLKKNGYTSGIPKSHLSACSHLYLSLIYKLQKKDKVSAKHLLEVFCNSPSRSRMELLPAIWSHLFFPHLYHLKVWYEKETEVVARSPARKKRLQVLESVYGNALDEGTYKFATYYKEWLMEKKEAPDLPTVDVPAEPFPHNSEEAPEIAHQDEASPGPSDTIHSQPSNQGQEWADRESHKSSSLNIPDEQELNVDCEDVRSCPSTDTPNTAPQAKDHELALKKLAQAVFQHPTNDADDFTMQYPQQHPKHNLHQNNLRKSKEAKKNGVASTTNSGMEPFPLRSGAESFGCYEGIDQGSFFSSIPNEFMCPLTGHLFKDPVTLDSGQTFERAAIGEWFKQGNTTCPVTGRVLESLSVPVTNFVLKRVISGWKSEHCRNLLVFATQIAGNVMKDHKSKDEAALFIIEQLLTGFNTEERKENARHLISLGGLHFLTRRLELGNLDEKIRVASLLLCCIEADGSCRSFLSVNIRGPWILELLNFT